MKDEIKERDYVRTRYGEIGIITEIYPRLKCKKRKNATIIEYNEIAKHSPNIIDLIEVGDYINGKKVLQKIGKFLEVSSCDIGNNRIYDYMIKSIVTKEQFKEMEYKV